MGANCGHDSNFDGTTRQYKNALWAVIAINGVMFVVEMIAGAFSHSMALKADALDFLGDSLTYGLSLVAIGMSLKFRAVSAMIKGVSLAVLGFGVLAASVWSFFIDLVPDAPTMGWIGFLALLANVVSVLILIKFRDGDANVRSVWLCSRNDAIGNVAVIIAAGLVAATQSRYPDLVVAVFMSSLFLSSAWQILRQANGELKALKVR
ncbi:MAG: cation diffusion facilitator family transporter [Robiginitomaculum sp.]|nr:cation diffusion facilitator family transporter [Robiginitomaculum sp.]